MSTPAPRIRRSRFASALAVGLGAFALIPATASAHQTTFGSSLNHSPANAGSTCAQDGVTGSPTCTHVGSDYPGTSGHAQSPVSGTITAIRLRAQGPTTIHILLVQVLN